MTRRRLPIGVQTFRKLRGRDCYYVDKTACIERLLDAGAHYFLSRPRRFGKNLLLDTLKELIEGLHIHDGHDWSRRHPVLRPEFMAVRTGGSFCSSSRWSSWRRRGRRTCSYYADRYHLLAVGFSRETRNVTAFEVADG